MKLLALLIGLLLAFPAQAATCSAIVSAINFGAVSVRTGATNSTSGQVTVSCSGVLAGAIGTCLRLGAGSGGAAANLSPRTMRRGDGRTLPYELRLGGNGNGFGTLTSVYLLVPVVLGSGSVTVAIFGDITANSVAVGTGAYDSTFAGTANVELIYGTTSCATPGTSVAVPTFHVSADVVPSCELDVGGLDFGSIPGLINAPIAGQGRLQVRCTADTTFYVTLGLGSGAGVTGPTARKMTNLLSTLTYGLYQDAAHGLPWGNTLATARQGTGVGGNQDMTVYGLIAADQKAAIGVYSDSVVVTVNY